MRRLATIAVTAVVLVALVTGCAQPQPSRAPTATLVTPAPSAPTGTRPQPSPTNSPARSPTATVPTAPAPSPSAPAGGSPSAPAGGFDPERITLDFETLVEGLDRLTFLAHAGDGSGLLYAVEQRGTIYVVEADGTIRDGAFLDISRLVSGGFEQGLLGLAFHPQYAANGRLFVHYTDTAGDTVVAEYAAAPDRRTVVAESAVPILTVDQPFANHNGGMVVFGPDGYLYISLGDGGGGGDPRGSGQDLGDLLGSILRIDVDSRAPYAIPADNPFVDDMTAQPEIWSSGLRNPWRLSFDRLTSAMFIGDVGQGGWEEIDAEPAGAGGRNYGWSVMEGPDCFREPDCDPTGLTLPVTAYPRADGNCAVTGGYVYRGTQFPALVGGYLFSDYCTGDVWALDAATAIAAGEVEHFLVGSSGISPGSFGEDEAGELYLAGQGGEILRIVATER